VSDGNGRVCNGDRVTIRYVSNCVWNSLLDGDSYYVEAYSLVNEHTSAQHNRKPSKRDRVVVEGVVLESIRFVTNSPSIDSKTTPCQLTTHIRFKANEEKEVITVHIIEFISIMWSLKARN